MFLAFPFIFVATLYFHDDMFVLSPLLVI